MKLNILKRQVSGAALALACNASFSFIIAAAVATAILPNMVRAADSTVTIDIPAGSVAEALKAFSEQSGLRIIGDYGAAERDRAPAVKGTFTYEQALRAILADSSLEVAQIAGDRVSLHIKRANSTAGSTSLTDSEPMTEVVVTGSHIRGGNSASPIRTVTEADIQRSGYSNIGDLMRSLPENFSGGQNPGVLGADAGGAGNFNSTGASTINLRGLGADATLVLLNGHRLSGDGDAMNSDISGVPLAAIRRVEVVPDGASALYGSDAVAGVVNIILKKAYSGFEVNVTGGASSKGGGTNRQISLLGGFQSNGWFGMVNLESQSQDSVIARDRERTASVAPQTTLVGGIHRRSLFVSGGRDITDDVTVSVDALVSERIMFETLRYTPTSLLQEYSPTTPAFSATINLDARLPGGWKLHAYNTMAGSRNSQRTFYPARNIRTLSQYQNTKDTFEAVADGTLFTLPAGSVKVAVGGGTRHESFNYPKPVSRQINYAFAEALIPLVAPSATRVGLHELEVNVSGRSESYSSIGGSTDPKVGLRYVPANGWNVRASWGTSFKAPNFLQLYQARTAYLINARDLGYGTTGVVLTTGGGNPDLRPEKSRSWTLGADYTPSSHPGLSLSASYFSIHYKDRITIPTAVLLGALSTDKYAPFVEASPASGTVTAIVSAADRFVNISSDAYDPTKVVAIFRDSYVNASRQDLTGFDVGYRQAFSLKDVRVLAFANASFLTLEQQLISTAPTLELSGTIFNVPKSKVRGGVSVERGSFSGTLIGNYVSSSKDTGIIPNKPIGSWTTADLTIAYAISEGPGEGLRIALSATNVFDRAPPYAYSPSVSYAGLNYDSTNASILGRYTSLSITKAW